MHTRALAFALAFAAASAGAQTLKPGLWDIRAKPQGNAQMDQEMAQMQQQMASMPPEQRKQMEEMMARQGVKMGGAAGGGMAVQVCMTKEMVERNDVPVRDGCTVTRNERSGNKLSLAFTCANPPSKGEGELVLASAEAYTSRMKVTTTVQGKPETVTMEGGGQWLKADCGNVKPLAAPKK